MGKFARLHNWRWGLLIGLVGAWCPHEALAQTTAGAAKVVAVVNGEEIGRAELDQALKRLPPPPNEKWTPERQRLLERDVLALMIDEVLFRQFLARQVPEPDRAVVEKRFAELEASLRAAGRTLEEYCQDTGQTPEQIRRDIVTVIRWNAYVKRKLTDQDIERAFQENQELLAGTLIRARHIAVRAQPGAEAKIRARLTKIREEIEKGLDFAEAARKYSEDSSAERGGDLGYFPPRANDADPFVRAASRLAVGQISDIVQTDFGFHLIQVTERKPGKSVTLEQAREDARLLAAEELRHRILLQERQKARIQVFLP